jgi:hypothetical protein
MDTTTVGSAVVYLVLFTMTTCCGGRAPAPPPATATRTEATAPGQVTCTETKDEETLHWRGKAKSLEVRGMNGLVRAIPSNDAEVDVVARVIKRRRTPPLRLQVLERGALTLVCVVPSGGGRDDDGESDDDADDVENDCAHRGGLRDTNVEITVAVPKGMKFSGWTANGSVEAEGLDGEVEAHTQNGSVRIATLGIARASTVNGSIQAKLGATRWDGTLAFESVNGRLDVELSPGVGAQLKADTMHGSIHVAPPLDGARIEDTRVEGRLGKGGGGLRLQTVNGPIDVR